MPTAGLGITVLSDRRRVLYVQPNNEVGGSDIALLRTLAVLDQQRFAPLVALPGDGPLTAMLRAAGAEVHFLPMVQLRTVPSFRYQARYLAGFVPSVRDLAAFIRAHDVDLVHSNSLFVLYGAWAARLAGRRHLWHVREIPPNVPVARQLYARMVLALSDVVVVMNNAMLHGLFGEGPAPRKVVFMADGIDGTRWHPGVAGTRIRAALGFAPDTPVVGFVARLDPWKGLEVFLRAARIVADQVPAAQFVVSGDAPDGFEGYRDAMKALAVSLGIAQRVHFLGWRYRLDDMPEVMASFDVLCHTPLKPEPYGLVVLEAMAVGRPVVAPQAGGPADFVLPGETGYLAPIADAAGFAGHVVELLRDPALRAHLGHAASRRIVEHYSYSSWASRLAEIYDHILA